MHPKSHRVRASLSNETVETSNRRLGAAGCGVSQKQAFQRSGSDCDSVISIPEEMRLHCSRSLQRSDHKEGSAGSRYGEET
jgi:hypothetical protein